MFFLNKRIFWGVVLAALIFIPLFSDNFRDNEAFSLKAIILISAGLIILAITFASNGIAQAIEGKGEADKKADKKEIG